MLMMVPRAAVCADRITEVLDTAHVGHAAGRRRCSRRPAARLGRPRRRHVLLPRRRGPGALRRLAERPARADDRDHRLDRRRQDHPGQPGAAAVRRDRRHGARSTAVDVRDLDPEVLWSDIGLVPQRAYLFTGTVRSNLLHGRPDATDDELWEALEVAQARDFVEALPEGLDAPVVAGRHQRLRRPAAAAGDRARRRTTPGDLPLRRRLLRARPGHRRPAARGAAARSRRTRRVLVVAQRVSTILDADQIVVLEDGRVVGRGTHDELLASCVTYQEIVALPADRGGGGMSSPESPGAAGPGKDRLQGDRADRGPGPRSRARPDGRRHGRPEGDGLRAVGEAAAAPDGAGPRHGGARGRCSASSASR